jgi:peptide/nickel transport system substrate-binding protein
MDTKLRQARSRVLGPTRGVATRTVRVAALVSATLALLIGVAAASAAPDATGTVTIRVSAPWTTLDIQTFVNHQVGLPGYDRLVAWGPNQKIIPYLATSWTVKPKSITFKLRGDAVCSDGTKITAAVVRNSFSRYFNPSTPAPTRLKFFGPGPYKVSANNRARTFTLTVGTPYELLRAFALPMNGIVCPSGLADPSKLAQGVYGSGPYTLVSYVPGDNATFRLRPNWKWGPAGATAKDLPQTLILKIVTNETTAANLLLTGGVDVSPISGPDVPRLQSNKALTLQRTNNYSVHPILFNMAPGHPTTELAVRKAMATAFDNKVWNRVGNGGYGIPSTSLFTSDSDCFDPGTARLVPQPSIDRARAILTAAGYRMDDGTLVKNGSPLTVRLHNYPGFWDPAAAEYLVSQWTKVGIDVKLTTTDFATWFSQLRAGNFDATIVATGPVSPSLAYGSSPFHGPPPPRGQNYAHIDDQVLESAFWAALKSRGKKSCENWGEFQRRLLERQYIVPTAANLFLFFSRKVDFVAANVYIEPYSIRKK